MEKSCGAVVYRIEHNKILYLLLHYAKHHWDFPKGHVEQGEREEQTTRREVDEETGITDLELSPTFHEKISYFFTKENRRIYKEVVFFLAKTSQKKVKLSDEHIGYKWLEYEQAKTKLSFQNAKNILRKADTHLSSTLPITKADF